MKRYGTIVVGAILAFAGCGGGGTLTCKTPQVACGSACVDTSSDTGNCGKCGAKCDTGKICSAGMCIAPCDTGMTACAGTCTDTKADVSNCGACGTKCPTGQACAAGKCAMVAATGAACKTNTDCGEGKSPMCWKNWLANKQFPSVMGGYCSSKCNTNADCGASACVDFGSSLGKWCVATCMADSDCRGAGFACTFGGSDPDFCFDDSYLDCDPSAGDGTCMTTGMMPALGGCQRQAYGKGKRGVCNQLCDIGTGTCPKDFSGAAQDCLMDDNRWDSMGKASGDKFVGPVCFRSPSDQGPLDALGKECLFPDGKGGMAHYIDVCVDGSECFVKGSSPMGMGFSSAGDNVCRQLCYVTGGKPAGTMGMPAGDCPMSTKCTDVFGTANATTPQLRVGFCL